jgi:hypothetical protein
VKLVLKDDSCALWPKPSYLFDFVDRLIIQSVLPFRDRPTVLASLFTDIPDRLACGFRLKFYFAGEHLQTDLQQLLLKREVKFTDLFLYNITTEYTDRLESVLKQARSLRIYKSQFRQIFPKPMINETRNEIESLAFEEVDFRVKNTILLTADRLKVISMKQTQLRPQQLEEVASTQIQQVNFDNMWK